MRWDVLLLPSCSLTARGNWARTTPHQPPPPGGMPVYGALAYLAQKASYSGASEAASSPRTCRRSASGNDQACGAGGSREAVACEMVRGGAGRWAGPALVSSVCSAPPRKPSAWLNPQKLLHAPAAPPPRPGPCSPPPTYPSPPGAPSGHHPGWAAAAGARPHAAGPAAGPRPPPRTRGGAPPQRPEEWVTGGQSADTELTAVTDSTCPCRAGEAARLDPARLPSTPSLLSPTL